MAATPKLAVALMSGGMDSTVAAALVRHQGYEIAALHVTYAHRTARREQRAFHDICEAWGISRQLVVSIDYLRSIGGSALTDERIPVPEGRVDRAEVPPTYVPFRNANLLSIATSWAEVLKAEAIVIGAVEEDSSGYPDCRQVFYEAFQRVIELGTHPETRITLLTPVIHMRKCDIVRTGVGLRVPFHLTWSCYVREDIPCGRCDSCLLRLRGFQEAGVPDPLPYDALAAE
ncbi:MAG: 7-cyano-7-deazaguanine synthase QueC [Candidatus Kapabacteria bacterium]|nr:7-cyano-7-deazaguanine synthase QueC [Candidatus Kapabacteria bacterium]MDW8011658.1 7-cyano-7-deazaguanine synthase QueC [Bacteroidota bacterium]